MLLSISVTSIGVTMLTPKNIQWGLQGLFWHVLTQELVLSKGMLAKYSVQFSRSVVSDYLLTPWTAAHQASLSITNSHSLLKLMSIESVMSSNHLILCHPLLFLSSIFPRFGVFSNESGLWIRQPNNGVLASASVLPMNTQDWSPLG